MSRPGKFLQTSGQRRHLVLTKTGRIEQHLALFRPRRLHVDRLSGHRTMGPVQVSESGAGSSM